MTAAPPIRVIRPLSGSVAVFSAERRDGFDVYACRLAEETPDGTRWEVLRLGVAEVRGVLTGPTPRCDCPGFEARGHCVHLAGLRALLRGAAV